MFTLRTEGFRSSEYDERIIILLNSRSLLEKKRSVIIITIMNSNRRDEIYVNACMKAFYDRVCGCISSRWLSYSDVAIYSPL